MFAQDFLLEQIITEPIRCENILDLCFVSHPSYINQYKIVPGLSDYDAIIVDIVVELYVAAIKRKCIALKRQTGPPFIRNLLVFLMNIFN